MTIDEAIEIFDGDTQETILNLSELRSDELAAWLKELKELRSMIKSKAFSDGYFQGVKDFADKINTFLEQPDSRDAEDLVKIAKKELLKRWSK